MPRLHPIPMKSESLSVRTQEYFLKPPNDPDAQARLTATELGSLGIQT